MVVLVHPAQVQPPVVAVVVLVPLELLAWYHQILLVATEETEPHHQLAVHP
jgi:hypothetical protein